MAKRSIEMDEEEYSDFLKLAEKLNRDKAAGYGQKFAELEARKLNDHPVAENTRDNTMTQARKLRANFLFSIGKTRKEVADDIGVPSQNLTHHINSGSIRCKRR